MPSLTSRPATSVQPPTPVIIASLTPAPTPVTHIIQKGETLISIALDYGLSIADLQAANPNVQPQFLTIGTILIIPTASGTPVVGDVTLPTVTPVPLIFSDPVCYPLPSGSTQCLAEVRNPNGIAISNIAARFTLADAVGLPLADGVAYAPLDLLPPGETAPLALLISPSPRGVAAINLTLLAASFAPAETSAFPLDIPQHSGTRLANQWTVTGQIYNPTTTPVASVSFILSLYNTADQLIGYRHATSPFNVPASATQNFSITAAPLTGAVDHYRLLVQGQP